MTKWLRETIYGVIIAIVSLILINDTKSMNEMAITYEAAKAGVYSRVWLYALLALSIIMVVRAVVKRDNTKVESLLNQAPWVTIILLVLYLLVINTLGFMISTILYLVLAMTYYTYRSCNGFKDKEGNWFEKKIITKKIIIIIVCSVIVTFATYLLFTKAVKVLLPEFKLF